MCGKVKHDALLRFQLHSPGPELRHGKVLGDNYDVTS